MNTFSSTFFTFLSLVFIIIIVIVAISVNADDAVKQQLTASITRVEKSLANNPNSAPMWLNAGAQLMKADDVNNVFESSQLPATTSSSAESHTIMVDNKKYNSEQALVKCLEIDRKQSLAWHYLALILLKQTALLEKPTKKSHFATAKVGSYYFDPVTATSESVRWDQQNGKTWAGASHILQQLLDIPHVAKYHNISTLTFEVDEPEYNLVQLVEKGIELEKGDNSVLWRYAAKALILVEKEQKKSATSSSSNYPTIHFANNDFDAVQCLENSLQLYKDDLASWNLLCETLKPNPVTGKGRYARIKKSDSSSSAAPPKNTNKENIHEEEVELIDRQACLQKAVEQGPQNSRAWFTLAHEMMMVPSASKNENQLLQAKAKIAGTQYSILKCIENGLMKCMPGGHFPQTIRQNFRSACSLLTLASSTTSSSSNFISLKNNPKLDALQCWEELLGGSAKNLAGTTSVASDPSDVLSWEALGNSLLSVATSANDNNNKNNNNDKQSDNNILDEVFIAGESYDALGAFKKAIELVSKSPRANNDHQFVASLWISLGKALSVQQRKFYASLSKNKNRETSQHHQSREMNENSAPPPRVVFNGGATTYSTPLEIYAKAVHEDPTLMTSWETLCGELANGDLFATSQRTSVAVQLNPDTRFEPVRIEQQMCFLEIFKRDPLNKFAWTNFKILTPGATIQIPGWDESKTPLPIGARLGRDDDDELRLPQNITSNLDFRLLAARRFPRDSLIWTKLAQELIARELNEAVFTRSRHMSLEKVLIRAIENNNNNNQDQNADQALVSLASIMSPARRVNVTIGGIDNMRNNKKRNNNNNLDRINIVVEAIKINKRNAIAWQNLGVYLAESVIYDSGSESSIDSAGVVIDDDETEDEEDNKKEGVVVNAQQALATAAELDPSLFGAWVNLALVLRKKSQEAGIALATPEQQKMQVFMTKAQIGSAEHASSSSVSVNAVDCLVKAIELTEGDSAPRRQPNSFVVQLYSVLSDILSETNRHVAIRGKTLMANDVVSKIKQLRNE